VISLRVVLLYILTMVDYIAILYVLCIGYALCILTMMHTCSLFAYLFSFLFYNIICKLLLKCEAQNCMWCNGCWAGRGSELAATAEAVLYVTFCAYYCSFNHH
jgi:hypothetical protein